MSCNCNYKGKCWHGDVCNASLDATDTCPPCFYVPRKIADHTIPTKSSDDNNSNSDVKKKRGRPRKDPSEEPVKRRGPGRPKKYEA